MHIVGTAGHVDHGKSALVNALTGTNPDRWLEEQLRGMTLDLGFAHLNLDGIEAGIIDVPGHERFLHNMLAGAAGMELLLLVIAADEGVRQQTVEHLQILRYLNVRATIVAVTKSDLLSPEDLARSCEAIGRALQGTIAQDAPLIPVSSTTRAGLDDLCAQMRSVLAQFPPRNPDAPAYLPIDRVFVLPGHGTIVTGTLMQGTLNVGDRVKLEPSGKAVRVRSLQSFGKPQHTVAGGARVAANLPGVEVSEIARGEVLVASELASAQTFAVQFSALPEALGILRRRNAVRAYIGSAEILGTLVLGEEPRADATIGGTLFLRRATVAYPGTAFVVRRLSPKNLLGGGRIESGALAAEKSSVKSHDEDAVLGVLRRGLAALTPTEIAREANLREARVEALLKNLESSGDVLAVSRPAAFVGSEHAEKLLQAVLRYLEEAQTREPWAMGATSVAIARALDMPEPLLVRLLNTFADEGRLARRAGFFSTAGHTPQLTAEQQAFFEELVPIDPANPFLPAELAAATARVRQSPVTGAGRAFDMLLAKGAFVKVNEELYRGTQVAQIRARLQGFVREHGRMTMAEFRDLIGTSRKYAVPLLEWFDSRGITVRSGDYRMLRGADEAQA
ncbi:MAG TPA: selenocysteine-specific translation elongation factor [Candidatus Rubrimentiphilum sp.]|nr:selenocysteine-specific translation elongation factor [Candidatus Rubrimentiphilum sp.]